MTFLDYSSLYKQNHNFRSLFNANLVSLFGDWFNFVAISHVLLSISNDKSTIALMFIIHLMPYVIFTTSGGILADKISRRKIMMISDLMRFFTASLIVIAVFFQSSTAILTLLFIQFSFAAFFEPSRSAIIPTIVKKENLYIANASMATVWSLMMALGTSLGGVVVYFFNAEIAIIIDAFSYLLSFYFVKRINVIETHIVEHLKLTLRDLFRFNEIIEAIKYIRQNLFLVPIVLSKGALEIYVGALIFYLTLYGEHKFAVFGSAALGIGLLQMMRGLGTGIGPIISKRFFKTDEQDFFSLWIGLLLAPIGYFFLSGETSLILALLFVFIAHIGGSANWVTSEHLIHKTVPNKFLGRIVSLEFVFLTLTMTLSVKFGAILMDSYNFTIDEGTKLMSYVGIGTALIWMVLVLLLRKNFKRSITN
jgi:MFS family permease